MIRFNKWIYVIPGFTQHRGTRTKMIDLWARLYANLGGNGTSIQCQPWCADWRSEAELICRTSEFNPEIYVIAYSWGAGWGFTQLSKQLRQRGYRINHAWLIDPVYRHNYVLGQWRALVPGIPIKVPSNVDHVTWWRQNETYPKGHDLKAKDGAGTFIDEAQWVEGVAHIHMDDHQPTLRAIEEQLMSKLDQDLMGGEDDQGDSVYPHIR